MLYSPKVTAFHTAGELSRHASVSFVHVGMYVGPMTHHLAAPVQGSAKLRVRIVGRHVQGQRRGELR